jgi:hypothetical protein
MPAEQSLRTEVELLNASIGGRGTGGEENHRVRIAEYFPYHQGDSWTYDWKYGFGNGQSRATERKRWFEGTKFTNAGAAFKLVSSTGEEDYQYYVLDKQGLRIVESGEKGMRAQGIKIYYDPPLWIAREDMAIGRTYRWSQPEQEGSAPVPVRVRCSPALDIEIDASDAATRAIVHEEMSQFVTHRQPRKPFEKWYGPEKAKFRLGKELPEGQEIFIEGDSMGSSYLISQGTIRRLSRNTGRMDFTIFNRKHQSVADGRYIATEYGVSYYIAGSKQEIGAEWFEDAYVKQAAYWVPKSRIHTSTMKGKSRRIELQVSKLEYLK